MIKELDAIQRALIAFFKKNTNHEGVTLREIASAIGANHPQTVLNKLNQLVLKGYFTKEESGYRLLRESITDQYTDIIQVPIFGFAQCGNKGKKIINEYSQEKIPMTMAMLGTKDPGQCFFVRAKGNSMEPKIQDSDLILVKQQNHYDPNDYVLIEHNELPKLKKILQQDGKLFLESVNRFFDKVEIVKYDQAKIIGVVKKIIKSI